MSNSSRDRTVEEERQHQQLQVRELERVSTVLIDAGIQVIKKNPIPTGLYFVGLLLCLFFNGINPTEIQQKKYVEAINKIDSIEITNAADNFYDADAIYRRSKGWFSCDKRCQNNKIRMQDALLIYNKVRKQEENLIADAKSSVGLFSSYGVSETRNLFWERFAQGKGFAQRQSKWDAIFMGISAMARDESMISYILRVLMSMLFNFTIGVFGAVVAFIFSLYGLIQTYRASLITGLIFFSFAAISAVAFAMTWLIGLYSAAAGTVYVGAKFAAANLRVQDSTGNQRRPRNIRGY